MLSSPLIASLQASLGFPFKRFGGNNAKTFGQIRNATPSTVEEPAVYTSRRCYITVATGTPFTVPVGAEVRFNDSGAWISANGNTPGGAKFWRVRGESSTDNETAVTFTPTLNGVNYPFVITTMADLSFGPTWEDSETWDDTKTWNE